jgi:outer membrane protein
MNYHDSSGKNNKWILMKNGLLIWNVILTLLIGYLLIIHFSSGKPTSTKERSVASDTAQSGRNFSIAYFEMDSVEANFDMVKDVKAELSKKEDAINTELENLSKKFQQRYNYFQNKAQGGTLTQTESEAASQELKNMDDQIKNRKEALNQEYGDFASKKMKDIKTRIEEFVKEYNQTKNYSYIVAEEPGFFYYKDTIYNITGDVIRGLNGQYKTSKKE